MQDSETPREQAKGEPIQFNPDVFLEKAAAYLEGRGESPSIVTRSIVDLTPGRSELKVHFYDEILRQMTEHRQKFRRDLTAISRYGFRGGSRGGINGVVLVNQNSGSADVNFGDLVAKSRKPSYAQVCEQVGFNEKDELTPVKVVCHRKNGGRLVGVLNRRQGRAFIFAYGTYTK